MKKWLVSLQKKPLAVRRNYSYIGSFVVTGLIVAVWATTQSVPTLSPVADATSESGGAMSRFFDRIGGQVAAVFESSMPTDDVTPPPPETDTAPTATTSNIFLPDVTAETAAVVEARRASTTAATTSTTTATTSPRTILIATSTDEAAE